MNPIQIKLKVHIHKVKLQVRFACTLLAYLNVQNQEIPFSIDQIPLQSGEAKFQSSVSQVFSIFFNSEENVFSEKNVFISLILKTAKGRISAGSATIDLNKISKQTQKLKLPLEKCPDKQAYIEASMSYQIFDEASENTQTIDEKLRTKSYTFQKCKSKSQEEQEQVQCSFFPAQSNKSQLRISKQESKAPSLAKLELNQSIQSLKLDLMQSLMKSHTNPALKSHHDNSSPVQQSIIKSKLGESERQMKNIHKKYEQASIDLRNTHAKLDIVQKSLKQSELQMKSYRQKYEDLDRSNSHVQKRNQFKQNNLKEQIKTLTQKLTASDSQRQSMIFQKNSLISEFEQRQRGLRLSLRQKQRSLTDQRNKLSRKNEQMAKELNSFSIKIGQYDLKFELLTKQLNLQVRKSEALEQTCESLRLEAEEYRQSYLQQKMKRQQLDSIASQFQQTEQEKKRLKKKIAEQELQNAKFSKVIVELETNYKKYLNNSQQMQSALKEKMTSLKALQKDVDNSAKCIDSMKKLLEQKQKTISQTVQQRQKQSEQVENLNNQQRQSERRHLQQVKSLTKDIHDKQALIQRLYSEINQSKQLAIVYDDKISKFQTQMEELNNKLTQMDHEHDELKFNKIALEDTISDLEGQIETEKTNHNNKEQNWKNQLKIKQNQIRKLEENLKKMDSSNNKSKQQYNIIISQLQDKVLSIESDKMEKIQKIESLNALIKVLEQEKSLYIAKNQELQYKLGLRAKQIAFLKQNAEKSHQENIQLSTQISDLLMDIQNLNEIIIKKQQQLSSMTSKSRQKDAMKQQIRKDFDEYVRLNKQSINCFLSAILNEPNIASSPVHQQFDIQTAMQASLKKINQIYKDYNQKIFDLEKQIQQKTNSYNQRLKRHQQTETDLEMSLAKNQQHSKELETEISQLKTDKITLNNKILNVQKDWNKVIEKNKCLENEIQILSNKMEKLQLQNTSLQQNIEGLLQSLKNQDEDFSIKSTRQFNKFQQQAFNLKLSIKELQQKLKRQEGNNIQLSSRLAEYKDQTTVAKGKSTEEIARLKGQLQMLFTQSQKKSKRLEENQALYLRSAQAQKDLTQKLQAANVEIGSLKQLSENTRRLYENSSQKSKEQEETICHLKTVQSQLNARQSELQKSLKERTSELTTSRQLIFNLENEKIASQHQLDIATALLKVKQDTIIKIKNQLANLSKQKDTLSLKLKQNSQNSSEQQQSYQRQIGQLIQSKDKCNRQLSVTKLDLQTAKQQLINIQKKSRQQIGQLQAQTLKLNHQITQLKEKLSLLSKNFSQLQKTKAVQDQYLKPIRDNMQYLRGNLTQYSRTGDQFQSSKNKLLKVASTKVDSMNEKLINQRMKQFSMAYNKLKGLVLSCQLEEQKKSRIGDQLKRVQIFLDRVLRGEK